MSSQFNDTDDDLPLHTRRSARESYVRDDTQAADMAESRPADREVTLNTGIVLGLFFALALLCAVFFGFGYSIGHKSGAAAAIAAEPDNTTSTDSTTVAAAGPKPSPGSPAAQPVPEYVSSAGAERAATPAKAVTTPTAAPPLGDTERTGTTAPTATASAKPAPILRTPPSAVTAGVAQVGSPSSSAVSGGSYVQIAAVSHQEDADVLINALRHRGYVVLTRSDAADKLIHVQIGPFSNRKEADAMRQKLAGDGYNAFIK